MRKLVKDMADFNAIVEEIKNAKRIMTVAHVSPEGDATGSMLAMAHLLWALGKECVPYLEDPVPEVLEYLPGSDKVCHDLSGEAPFDLTISLDCGDLDRLGKKFVEFEGKGTVINIDHHITNSKFGKYNLIDAQSSATGEVLYDFAVAAGFEISKDAAINMYTAIVTDTGNFIYSSTSADTLRKSGHLVDLGVDAWDIAVHLNESHPERRMHLLGDVLNTLEVKKEFNSKVAFLNITLDSLAKFNATREDSDGFVDYGRSIKGVEVAVLFREDKPGGYKLSMRSKGLIDVSNICSHFGGGGHKNASGCYIEASLEEAKSQVVAKLQEEAKLK